MRVTGASSLGPSPDVRAAVRALLCASTDFHALDENTRKAIAGSMVRIADTAKALAADAQSPVATRPAAVRALNAGGDFSGVAANRVADTTKAILNAVSFPRFVTELINGVFKALNDSNQQQLASYIELIQNVSNTLDGFADANVGISGARSWLAEKFPGSFVVQGDEDLQPEPGMSAEERRELQAERDASTRLRLVPGGSMPSAAALKAAFGLGPEDTAPSSGDPENLVPLARAAIASNRQKMLSTMVMMGMQRIVIESGRLNASMRFHIDTRSAAAADAGSSFDTRTNMDVSGGAKFGPWGMEAKVQSTIGYVSTQRSQTTEEMNTDLDLSSNVELIFKTDYVQLDRLAGGPTQERIRVNAMNPEAEAKLASEARTARRAADGAAETARSGQLNERLARAGPLPPSTTNVPKGAPEAPAQPPKPPQAPPPPAPPTPPGTGTGTPPGAGKPPAPPAAGAGKLPAPPTQKKAAPAQPPPARRAA
ncbi:MAG: hypothetical protein ABI624_02050 [Casimicrobiaceae bacterium]